MIKSISKSVVDYAMISYESKKKMFHNHIKTAALARDKTREYSRLVMCGCGDFHLILCTYNIDIRGVRTISTVNFESLF